ncbi:MAG TPA: hypothetical protein VD858_06280 [Reyranella sp.]|nr:hypothetical protein [Reyranella sp.]
MAAQHLIRALTVCAAAMVAAPATACESGNCSTSSQTVEAKPLKLKTFMRKPVATSATRTVKKKDGGYAKVAIKRRAQPAPPVTPETISPAAASAFASYELARVRVVTPEEANGASLLSDTAAMSSSAVSVVGVDNVQVVSASEVNDIDRKADSPSAVSLDTLSRNLPAAAEPAAESESWFQRIMVFGGAFAAVAALVRALLG